MATESPITASAAGRYAGALYELALEQGNLAETERGLNDFDALLGQSQDLVALVRSPTIGAAEQAQALGAVLDKAGIGGLSANFLKLIARNRRLFLVRDMIKVFRSLAAQGRGRVEAEVTSAVALSAPQVDLLKDTLKGSIGKDVELKTNVDPELLGGLVVKIGSRMIDSSIRTKLNSLKTAMKEAN